MRFSFGGSTNFGAGEAEGLAERFELGDRLINLLLNNADVTDINLAHVLIKRECRAQLCPIEAFDAVNCPQIIANMKKSKKALLFKDLNLVSGVAFIKALVRRLVKGQPSLVMMLSPKLSPWSMTAWGDLFARVVEVAKKRASIEINLATSYIGFGVSPLSRGEYMIGLNCGSVDDVCWVSFDDAMAFSKLRKTFRELPPADDPVYVAAATTASMSDAGLTARLSLALGEVEQSDSSAVSGWQKSAGNHGRKTDPWPGVLTGEAEDEAGHGGKATDADASS